MNKNILLLRSTIMLIGIAVAVSSCKQSLSEAGTTAIDSAVYPSAVLPIFDKYKLILGDGSNAGHPIDFANKDYFYVENEGKDNWVVYKTPNGGNTHGTSNNTRFFSFNFHIYHIYFRK